MRRKKLKGIPTTQNVNVNASNFEDDLQAQANAIEQEWNNSSKGQIFIEGAEVGYQIVGAMGKSDLNAVEMVQQVLDKWIIRATKQFPITFGLNEGSSLSSNADQQAEILARQSDSLQKHIESLLNIHFTQILRNEGNLTTPIFRLTRFNALVEKQRLERFKMKIESIKLMRESNLITLAEARQLLVDPESTENISENLDTELPPELEEAENAEINVQEERPQTESEED